MNMSTFNNNDINIFDLSDELLLYIFNKLHTIELLYSLVNVNQRFDRLVLDPFYTHHLDLTVRPLRYYTSPVKTQIFDRIRTQVLPRIHQKLNKITVDPLSMECILGTIYYSELNSLSLVNFQSETLLQHLTGIVLSTCLFREDTGPNIDSVTKSTNKQTDGPTYGVFLETADIYIGKQINTYFYYCLLLILKNKLEN
ncbi:unnamed protein product [Rotaria socialis]